METISSASMMDSYMSFVKTEDFELSEYGFMNPGDTALEQMIHTERALSLAHAFDAKSDSENSLDDFCCFDSSGIVKPEPDSDYSDCDVAALETEPSSIDIGAMEGQADRFMSIEIEHVFDGRRGLEEERAAVKTEDNSFASEDAVQPLVVTINGNEVQMQDLMEGCFKTSDSAFTFEQVHEEVQDLDSLCPSLFTDCNDKTDIEPSSSGMNLASDVTTTDQLLKSKPMCTDFTVSFGREDALPEICHTSSKPDCGLSFNISSHDENASLENGKILEESEQSGHERFKGDRKKDAVDEKRIKDAVEKVKQKMARQKETRLKEKELRNKDREMKMWQKARLLSQKIARESACLAKNNAAESQKKEESSIFTRKKTISPNSLTASMHTVIQKSSGEMSSMSPTPLPTPPSTPSRTLADVSSSPSSVCNRESVTKSAIRKKRKRSPSTESTGPISEKHQALPLGSIASVTEVVKDVPKSVSYGQIFLLKSSIGGTSVLKSNLKAISPVPVLKLPSATSTRTVLKSLLKTQCCADSEVKKPSSARPVRASLLKASYTSPVPKTYRAQPTKEMSPHKSDIIRNPEVSSSASKSSILDEKLALVGVNASTTEITLAASKGSLNPTKNEKAKEGELLGELVKSTASEEKPEVKEEFGISLKAKGDDCKTDVNSGKTTTLVAGHEIDQLSKEKKKRINLSQYKNRLMERRKIEKGDEAKPVGITRESSYVMLEHNYCLVNEETQNSLKPDGLANQTYQPVTAVSTTDITSSSSNPMTCIGVMESAKKQSVVNASTNIRLLDVASQTNVPCDVSTSVSSFVNLSGTDRNCVSIVPSQPSISCSDSPPSKHQSFVTEVSCGLQSSKDIGHSLIKNSSLSCASQNDQSDKTVAPLGQGHFALEQRSQTEIGRLPSKSTMNQDSLSQNSLTLGYVLSKMAESVSKARMDSSVNQSSSSSISSVPSMNGDGPKQGSESWSSSESPSRGNSSERESRVRSRFAQRRKYRRRSSSSDSSTSSRSRSPLRRRSYRRSERNERSQFRSRSGSNGYGYSRTQKAQDLSEDKRWETICREERHVVFIGGIPTDFTKFDLIKKFGHFGEVVSATVHHRKERDSYGFVKFTRTEDADKLKSEGNKIAECQNFQFNYGGRRGFCKVEYADLDDEYENWYQPKSQDAKAVDFDSLLKETLKLQKKSSKM